MFLSSIPGHNVLLYKGIPSPLGSKSVIHAICGKACTSPPKTLPNVFVILIIFAHLISAVCGRISTSPPKDIWHSWVIVNHWFGFTYVILVIHSEVGPLLPRIFWHARMVLECWSKLVDFILAIYDKCPSYSSSLSQHILGHWNKSTNAIPTFHDKAPPNIVRAHKMSCISLPS